MIKSGQIRFTKKASEKAKEIFQKKRVNEFLIVVESGKQKPSNANSLYKMLLGVEQGQTSDKKVYTIDKIRAEKLFNTSLLNDGRLSLIFSPIYGCALYITKEQQDKYDKLKLEDHVWPAVYLNENDKACLKEFERKIITTSIDLLDLLLEVD